MQIVIDIPEEKLTLIKNKMYCGIYDPDLYKAIANGTPLEGITPTVINNDSDMVSAKEVIDDLLQAIAEGKSEDKECGK